MECYGLQPQHLEVFVGGAGSGLFRGGLTGVKSKNAIEGIKKGVTSSVNARMARDTRQQVGYGVKDRVGDKIAKFAGIPNEYGGFGKLDAKQKELERKLSNVKQDEDAARQALAELESRGPAVADRRNMDMANYELSKVMNSLVIKIIIWQLILHLGMIITIN